MLKKEINQNWRMRQTGGSGWQSAHVPGTVYTDLLRNEEMEDPYWRDNAEKELSLMEYDYEYETEFECGRDYLDCSDVLLRFEGLDTIADILINDKLVGKACNMHRTWEFPVKDHLAEGNNRLTVIFHSPLKYIREKFAESPTLGSEDAMDGFVHIRKAHCMFGWDWGAHLPDAGIFRPVFLLGEEADRIKEVRIHQEHNAGSVELQLEVKAEKAADHPEYRVTVTDPDGSSRVFENSPEKILIDHPRLWWPNGLGEQPLYTVKVELMEAAEPGSGRRGEGSRKMTEGCSVIKNEADGADGRTEEDVENRPADIWERRIGLRTLTIRREKDQWGESFAHEINGRTVFAMGADYIPEDHLLGRTSKERTRKLLEDCREANFNTIRVWGGGYYPEDWFYDLCDELGLMVWQDFMFACGLYDLTPDFEANVTQEFIDNIIRLRHHASLALWCGNNEMEMFVDRRLWVTQNSQVRDYLILFERIIPHVLEQYDPDHFYWPASPSSGGSFDEPNSPDRGDVHYWDVWHGDKPFSEYRKFYFRYVSEFGFQSFPCLSTVKTFTLPEDRNIFSYVMERHQRNGSANGKIINYMQQTYKYPSSFDLVLYTSQMLQADAIRYGVEHFRRNRGRCMGAIYWQLNDCWPVASWSSVDYTGRWKALHYFARRFFAPVMISCEEEGWLTREISMNWEHFKVEPSIRLNVANETFQPEQLQVIWAVRNADGNVLREEKEEITVEALASCWLEKTELPDLDVMNEYVSYEARKDGEIISSGTVIFSLPKYFKYKDPQLSCQVQGDEIIVKAQAYARGVEIRNEDETLILSDNYFDMNAGEKRVKILRGEPKGLSARSVYDIK